MSLSQPTTKFAWKTYQVFADKNPPVQDTEYVLLDETGGVRLVSISVLETNTETDNKEIDCIITKDGTTYTYDASSIGGLTHGQKGSFFMVTPVAAGGGAVDSTIDLAQNTTPPYNFVRTNDGSKPLEGHAIKVVLKMTSAAGTAQRLYYLCIYEKLEAV
jgi:hypothetical protein